MSSQPLERTPEWIRIDVEGNVTHGVGVPDLAALQEMVGGYIESAPTRLPATAFVNEEGKLEGLPVNPVASMLCEDTICGPMVVTGPADEQGELTPLTVTQAMVVLVVMQAALKQLVKDLEALAPPGAILDS
jgi:hypothetical protein